MSEYSNTNEFTGDPAYLVAPTYESSVPNERGGSFYWLPAEDYSLWSVVSHP